MPHLGSLNRVTLSLLLIYLLPIIVAANLVVRPVIPKVPEEHPPVEVPHPDVVGDPKGAPPVLQPHEGYPKALDPPFSESGTESESPDYKELADKVKDLIEAIGSLISSSSPSTTPVRPTVGPTTNLNSKSSATASLTIQVTLPTRTVNATLACEIYHAYTSICPPITTTTQKPYIIGQPIPSTNLNATRASCLCYSSTYYVPDVFDDAASVCANYTTKTSSPADITFAAAAGSAAHVTGFCSSVGNVKGEQSATFGQFTATSTSASAYSPPTAGAVRSGAETLYRVEREIMGSVILIAIMAIMV